MTTPHRTSSPQINPPSTDRAALDAIRRHLDADPSDKGRETARDMIRELIGNDSLIPQQLTSVVINRDRTDVFELMLDYRLVDTKVFGVYPLTYAAIHGSTKVAELLVSRGAPLDAFAFKQAASLGHADVVVLFLEHGHNSQNARAWADAHRESPIADVINAFLLRQKLESELESELRMESAESIGNTAPATRRPRRISVI